MELANTNIRHELSQARPIELNHREVHSESPARALCMDIQAMTQCSIAQVAKLCDIPTSTLYRLAMGTTRNPLYKTFDKLVRTYFMLLLEKPQASTELN